jgi:hypothetical protein
MKIRQTDTDISLAQSWVTQTRHFLEGEQTVKKRNALYLPKSSADQPATSYKLMKDHAIFYPATSRTLEGLAGLIFRKPPVVDGAPEGSVMARLLDALTSDAEDLLTFSYNVVCERLTSNFMGLLVDMPVGEADANLSPAQRVEQDQRPFVNVYTFENIVAREYKTVRGRRTLVYVRLIDADQSERELRLIDGEYWVTIHQHDGVMLQEGTPFQPLRNGKPLNRIPFFLNTSIRNGVIEQSPVAKIANLNLSHFRNEGLIAMSKLFQASPQGYVFGVEWPLDKDGKPFKPTVSPGTFWTNPTGENVQIGYLEYTGKGLDDLRADRDKIESMMAVVGVQMIAGEKIAAEAPETLAIRRASENSALATIANLTSKAIQDALNEMADWMGLPHVRFQLNTDFLPQPMTAAEIQAHVSLLQAGVLSGETIFLALRDGDVVNPTLTWEMEKTRLQNDQTDGLSFVVSKSGSLTTSEVPAQLPRNDKLAPLA